MSVAEPERRPGVISRVVSWLRAGYPGGVPTGDYVALLGVLRRRLSEAEIQAIAEELAAHLGARFDPPDLLRRMVAEGTLGRKSGRGFYEWENDR